MHTQLVFNRLQKELELVGGHKYEAQKPSCFCTPSPPESCLWSHTSKCCRLLQRMRHGTSAPDADPQACGSSEHGRPNALLRCPGC